MPCYYPLNGFRNVGGGICFSRKDSTGLPMKVACGQCLGCRIERTAHWSARIMHEASLHEDNCFLTLTYDDDKLPPNGSLDKTAFPLFMKRLRQSVWRKDAGSNKIRYFHCGEYGTDFDRPHYHALLFGYDFDDKVQWSKRGDYPTWRADSLERLWTAGFSEIGTVTSSSAAYVASYLFKKVGGARASDHYQNVDKSTGEISEIIPEYATMSRRPGIGKGWFEKYQNEVFPSDEVIVNGKQKKPPRFYDDLHREVNEEQADKVKRDRAEKRDRKNETPARLRVREVCAQARLDTFTRRLET